MECMVKTDLMVLSLQLDRGLLLCRYGYKHASFFSNALLTFLSLCCSELEQRVSGHGGPARGP